MMTACVAATEHDIETLLEMMREPCFVEEVCRSWGVKALHLGVALANRPGLAFYLKHGFGKPERYMLTKILAAGEP